MASLPFEKLCRTCMCETSGLLSIHVNNGLTTNSLMTLEEHPNTIHNTTTTTNTTTAIGHPSVKDMLMSFTKIQVFFFSKLIFNP